MIKRLRKNIILVNMLLVGVVILAILSAVCVNSYFTECDKLERSMNDTLKKSNRFGDGENAMNGSIMNGEGKRELRHDEPMQLSSYEIIKLSSDNSIKEINENGLSVESDTLTEAVKYITQNAPRSGQLNEYGLMYVREDFQGEVKIIFAQTSSLYSSLGNMILICLLLFVISMAVIFLISLWLSGIAVKPVKKAWEQQKQFVADASHELKTPLTVILANNNIMMSHKDSKISEESQWLESTEEEAQHMKQLIDQMLFLAKSDAGTGSVQLSDVDLSEIIEGTALNFEPVAFEREILINPDIEPDVIIHGNALQLKQLAHILIDNAVKYAADQSEVTITLKKSGDAVTFAVNNKGNVIEKDDLEHIFDRFYRAEKSRTTKGYGLGLSIAQNIVQGMNGKLTAESNEEQGTTFTARFK